MNKLLTSLVFLAAFSTLSFAQGPTWTSNTIQKYNEYDYELWKEDGAGNASMKLTGDDGSGANAKGGTFEASWSNTINVLFRSGRKFTSTSGQAIGGSSPGKTAAEYGDISIDFAATWSSSDNVKMLGIYGWAFYASGSVPTADENGTVRSYSNQIEYYIIQDRGSYNAAKDGVNAKKYGQDVTIDGIVYEFYVADRIGKNALTGTRVNFKQYFSVPKNTSSHRTSGMVSVSKHFAEWAKAGMKMDGPLYEVAMKVESYSQSGANGTATVTRNLLNIGGAPENHFSIAANASPASAGQVTRDPYLVFYPAGTEVTLTATAASGWKFDGWEGDASGTNTSTKVTVNANKNVTAKFSLSADNDINLVRDGNFPGTSIPSSWSLNIGEHYGNSQASANVSNGKIAITVSSATTNSWEPQLTQYNVELMEGMSYILTFKASATAPRTMPVSIQQSVDPWGDYAREEFSLTTAEDTYVLEFEMTKPSDPVAQLSFNLGGTSGSMPGVTISDVSLRYNIPDDPGNTRIKISQLSQAQFQVIVLSDKSLFIESYSAATVYLYNAKGNMVQKIETPAGSSVVKLSVPNGIYIVKDAKTKQAQRILVK